MRGREAVRRYRASHRPPVEGANAPIEHVAFYWVHLTVAHLISG